MLNLNYLRHRNMFQQDPTSSLVYPPDDESGDSSDEDINLGLPDENTPGQGVSENFTRLFQAARDVPPGPAESKYTGFLNEPVPQYKPTKMGKLAAILGGASEGYQRGAGAGAKTAHEILEAPYRREVAAHQLRGTQLKEAAEVESKNLGRAAQIARQATLANNAKIAADQRQAELNAKVTHWNAQDKASASIAANRGITHVIDPTTGHLIWAKPDGTRFDAGKVGETLDEKTSREFKDFVKREDVKQGNTIAAQENQGGITQTGQNKVQAAIGARETETQNRLDARAAANPQTQNREAQLRMKKTLAKYGDKVKDYIHQDETTGAITLTPGHPDDPVYRKLYLYIYGKQE